MDVIANSDVDDPRRRGRLGWQLKQARASGTAGQPEQQLLRGEMTSVGWFGWRAQVTREGGREWPIDRLAQAHPEAQRGRRTAPALEFADARSLDANPSGELLLGQTTASSGVSQVRAERMGDTTGFSVAVEFIARAPSPHDGRIMAFVASLALNCGKQADRCGSPVATRAAPTGKTGVGRVGGR